MGVQGGLPLAVLHVGLAARQVFDVLAVDHHHGQPRFLQHLVRAEPVNARGLHCHRACSLSQEVIAQGVEFSGNRAEDLGRSTGDGDVELFSADINGGSGRVQHGQGRMRHRSGLVEVFSTVHATVPGQDPKRTSLSSRKPEAHQPIRMSPAGTNQPNELPLQARQSTVRSRCAGARTNGNPSGSWPRFASNRGRFSLPLNLYLRKMGGTVQCGWAGGKRLPWFSGKFIELDQNPRALPPIRPPPPAQPHNPMGP